MKVLPDMNRIPWLLVLIAVVAAITIYRIGFHWSVPGFNYEAVTSVENSSQHEAETATALLMGCSRNQSTTNSLPIMELGRKTGPELVYLPNDYGFLIQWASDKTELYLYNKPENKITYTNNFDEFFAGLQRFPNGAKVDRIRGCAITMGWVSEKMKERLNQIIKDKDFHLTDVEDGNYSVCSCETTYVRKFTAANIRLQ